MRLLNRHILENFLVTFLATLVVVTFVMCLGAMFQITDLLARGVSWKPVAVIFFSAVPVALAFSIPVSAVTTSLLVFERLSGDGEISAMRACGVSIWQIVSRPILFATLLTGICLYIHTEVVSRSHYIHRKTIYEHKEELARSAWEPGRFVQATPGLAVYVGKSSYNKREQRTYLENVIVYDRRMGNVEREIRAPAGYVETLKPDGRWRIVLTGNVRIDPLLPDRPGAGTMTRYTVDIDVGGLRQQAYRKRMADFTAAELIEGIVGTPENRAFRMSLAVELNQRIVLSLSCVTFVLLGIPFGITTRRSSSTLGIAISLLIVFSFYLVVILVDSIAAHPELRPDLIMWTPAVAAVAIGLYMLRRIR